MTEKTEVRKVDLERRVFYCDHCGKEIANRPSWRCALCRADVCGDCGGLRRVGSGEMPLGSYPVHTYCPTCRANYEARIRAWEERFETLDREHEQAKSDLFEEWHRMENEAKKHRPPTPAAEVKADEDKN